MRPLRILRIITRLNVGGPTHHVAILSSRLDRSRFETKLVAGRTLPTEGDATDWVKRRGIRVTRLETQVHPIVPFWDLRGLIGLIGLIRDWAPDVVHTHQGKAGALGRLAAFLCGVPVRLHTYHGHVLEGYFSRTKGAFLRCVERFLGRISTRLLAVSPRIRTDLVEKFRIAPAGKVEVVPLGLDLEPYLDVPTGTDLEARLEWDIPIGTFVVAWVGRLTSIKDPLALLRIADWSKKQGKNWFFLVAGDGELRKRMEEEQDALGLWDRVRFLGWTDDLPKLYGAADVVLNTSVNEGTPVTLIEGMAAGRVPVAPIVGGIPDLVRHEENGFLYPPGDGQEAYRWLEFLSRREDRRRALGAAARESVRHAYCADRLVRDIERLYLKLAVENGL